jgi:putative oxidoreductase
MNIQGIITAVGRVMLSLIFLMSAAGNKIPNFNEVAGYMSSEGVPAARLMLVGAIAFLIVGSFSVIVGYKARIGASLLLIFLMLATYFFHDFWTVEDAKAQQEQMIQFMKNLALIGAMLLITANGAGPMSLDSRSSRLAENE